MRLQELNALYSKEGGALLAQHYLKAAAKEHGASNFLRVLAFAIALITVFLMTFSSQSLSQLLQEGKEVQDLKFWFLIFSKFSIFLIAIGTASWLIREGGRHQNRGNQLSDKSLALNTIDLYLATMDTPEQVRIKATLANQFFIQSEKPHEPNDGGIGFIPVETVNKALEVLTKKS